MMVSWVSYFGALEGELVTKILEKCVTLVPLCRFEGGVRIATNEDSSLRILFRKFINCIFKFGYFMDKFSIQAASWKIYPNVDCDGEARDI